MRRFAVLAVPLLAVTAAAWAAGFDAIPEKELKAYASTVLEIIQGQFPDPPVTVDADTDHPMGFHQAKAAAIVFLPDRGLNMDRLRNAVKPVPVGLLLTVGLSVIPAGAEKPAPLDEIAAVEVTEELKLPVFYLAARKQDDGLMLDVFSKNGKALLSVPVTKANTEEKPASRARLTITDFDEKTQRAKARVIFPDASQAEIPLGFLPSPE